MPAFVQRHIISDHGLSSGALPSFVDGLVAWTARAGFVGLWALGLAGHLPWRPENINLDGWAWDAFAGLTSLSALGMAVLAYIQASEQSQFFVDLRRTAVWDQLLAVLIHSLVVWFIAGGLVLIAWLFGGPMSLLPAALWYALLSGARAVIWAAAALGRMRNGP